MVHSIINILTGRAALALILLLGGVSASLAGTSVKNYAERLERAEAIADQMIEEEPSPEDLLAAIALIREQVPRSEEITISNQNIRVDNGWLHLILDELARIANGDPEQQRSMLIEVADRLFVLQERVNASIKVGDRNEALAKILARDEYRPDVEKESIVRKWLKSLWGFIARLLEKLPRPKAAQADPAARSPFRFFSLALGLLILAGVGYAVFRLLMKRRSRRPARDEDQDRVVLGEAIPEGVTAAELMRRATEVASRGDYRSAIRSAYIALLCELEERGKLTLHKSSTNRDYAESLSGDREIFRPFAQMTGKFEQTWYGQMETSAGEFDDYLNIYRTTFRKNGGTDNSDRQKGGG